MNLHNQDESRIALQLWDCCPKDLQTILRSNRMGNNSMEPAILTKIKAVTFTTQKVLVNVKNFICIRQQKVKKTSGCTWSA